MDHMESSGGAVTATPQQLDMQCLERTVMFVGEHGRMPSVSADVSANESVLGRWLASQQAAAASGSMAAPRKAVLDAAVPGWMPPTEALWLDRARECSNFVMEADRLPTTNGDEQECACARWLHTQLAVDSVGALPAEFGQWLRDHMPGWAAMKEAEGRR